MIGRAVYAAFFDPSQDLHEPAYILARNIIRLQVRSLNRGGDLSGRPSGGDERGSDLPDLHAEGKSVGLEMDWADAGQHGEQLLGDAVALGSHVGLAGDETPVAGGILALGGWRSHAA